MPLHGDGLLHGTASESERPVMGTKLRFISSWVVEARQHDDQLVGPRAVRCEAGYRVLGVLELVGVTDEDQALRCSARRLS
eukprot:scaffold98198_cov61-Phaeocystis_antarctica.AAC.1